MDAECALAAQAPQKRRRLLKPVKTMEFTQLQYSSVPEPR